nr:MAG TPA: hypothetical protein [Caudoviricetes sp.]
MIRCNNQRCKHNHREICVNMHLQIESERCICFEPKWQKKRKTNETDINHTPVYHSTRRRTFR